MEHYEHYPHYPLILNIGKSSLDGLVFFVYLPFDQRARHII